MLDNLQLGHENDYPNLWQATTIRLAPFAPGRYKLYEPLKPPKHVPFTPISEAHLSSNAFGADFTFCQKGDASKNPMLRVEALEQENHQIQTVLSHQPISEKALEWQSSLPANIGRAVTQSWEPPHVVESKKKVEEFLPTLVAPVQQGAYSSALQCTVI